MSLDCKRKEYLAATVTSDGGLFTPAQMLLEAPS